METAPIPLKAKATGSRLRVYWDALPAAWFYEQGHRIADVRSSRSRAAGSLSLVVHSGPPRENTMLISRLLLSRNNPLQRTLTTLARASDWSGRSSFGLHHV